MSTNSGEHDATALAGTQQTRHEDDAALLRAWETAIDLQKHFNDILTRIRNFYFLYFAAGGAVLAGIVKSSSAQLPHFDWRALGGAGAPAVALYVIDRFYYYALLVGAVRVSEAIENKRPTWQPVTALLTREERRQRFLGIVHNSRWKLVAFYSLPLAGAAYVLVGGWAAMGCLVGFVLLEAASLFLNWLADDVAPELSATADRSQR